MPRKASSTKKYAIPGDRSLPLTFHICCLGDGVDAVVMWQSTVGGPVQFAGQMLHACRFKEKIWNVCLWQSPWHVNVVAVVDTWCMRWVVDASWCRWVTRWGGWHVHVMWIALLWRWAKIICSIWHVSCHAVSVQFRLNMLCCICACSSTIMNLKQKQQRAVSLRREAAKRTSYLIQYYLAVWSKGEPMHSYNVNSSLYCQYIFN